MAGKVDEPSFVATVVEQRPDAVIHLAGLQIPTCRENPVLGASVNVIGSLNVFEAAKQIAAAGGVAPRIVYASSAAIFGPDAEYGEAASVGDASAPKPTSHYGAYKLCIEHCAQVDGGHSVTRVSPALRHAARPPSCTGLFHDEWHQQRRPAPADRVWAGPRPGHDVLPLARRRRGAAGPEDGHPFHGRDDLHPRPRDLRVRRGDDACCCRERR